MERTERMPMAASGGSGSDGNIERPRPIEVKGHGCRGLLTGAGAEAYVGSGYLSQGRTVALDRPFPPRVASFAAGCALALAATPGLAAKATECTKLGICYCVNDELKPAIAAKVDRFRALIDEQRKAGKAVGYLSVPLSPAGGGNFDVNSEVAAAAKDAIEKRFGADFVYALDPGTADADLPKGTGADYMLMWTTVLEGNDGLGEF